MGVSQLTLVPKLHGALRVSDLVINGLSLTERLRRHEKEELDHVSALGLVEGAFERLRMEEPPDLPEGRTSLMVCSYCSDLGCGAISAKLVRQGEKIIWQDLGVANNLEIDDGSPWLFRRVSAFTFDWSAYLETLHGGYVLK